MGKGCRLSVNSARSATDSLNSDQRQGRGLLGRVFCKDFDSLVGEIGQRAALVVVVGASRKRGIRQALLDGVGHGAQHVLKWRAEGLEGTHDLLALVYGPAIAADHGDYGTAIWRIEECGVGCQFIRGSLAELPVEAEYLLRFGQWVGDHPSQNGRADNMQLILEGGDHAEIAAAAAQAPKQILVFHGA